MPTQTPGLASRTQLAIAGAFVAGALTGWRAGGRSRRGAMSAADVPRRGRVAALVISLAGAIAMRIAREIALGQLAKLAEKRWGDGHDTTARA